VTALRRLLRDDRGSAMVASFVLMLALTGGAIIWLARDVDRTVNAANEADALAFQAARAAAQAVDPSSLRADSPRIDPAGAQTRAAHAAATLLASNHTTGSVVSVDVNGDRVTVVVAINEAGRTVAGRGTARLAVGVNGEGQ
jgi:hypothetical protein